MHEGIYLAFDFGLRRIGVAKGQTVTYTATPLPALDTKLGKPVLIAIKELIETWRPRAMIVGLPLALNGSYLSITNEAISFAKTLESTFTLPVHLVDERYTTKSAREHLFDKGGAKQLKKGVIDSVSACILLEQWFSTQSAE